MSKPEMSKPDELGQRIFACARVYSRSIAVTARRSGFEPCRSRRQEEESPEAGYMLLAVVFMVALVLLSLAIAAPKIVAAIQRDRELELVHRGEQYKRAIRLYYKKFGGYPSTMDQLEKSNGIRFLRKRYVDPMTGKDDWQLIRMGQAHVRPLGFFGQTLGASTGSSTTTSASGTTSDSGSSSSTFSLSSSFGSSGSSSSGSSNTSSGTTTGGTSGLYAANGSDDGTGSGSDSGSGSSSSAGPSGTSSSTSSSTMGGTSSSTDGGTGSGSSMSTTLGGAPVVGVKPPSPKPTILQYRLKTHYNEWEFVYDPVEEQTAAASITGGGSAASTSSSSGTSTGTASGTGSSTSGSTGMDGSSNSSGSGSSGGASGSGSGSTDSGSGSSGSPVQSPTGTPQ